MCIVGTPPRTLDIDALSLARLRHLTCAATHVATLAFLPGVMWLMPQRLPAPASSGCGAQVSVGEEAKTDIGERGSRPPKLKFCLK